MRRSSPAEELLCKAVGPALTVLDLTAGLGRDGLVLAAALAGRKVLLCERHPVLFHLLRDAIDRIRESHPDLASRLRIELRDSARDYRTIAHENLTTTTTTSTTTKGAGEGGTKKEIFSERERVSVYLDPMYPMAHTARRTAKSNKETQFLHRLAGAGGGRAAIDCEAEDNLLLFQVIHIYLGDILKIPNDYTKPSCALIGVRM